MSTYPRASDLPWGTLAVLIVAAVGLHLAGGVIDWLARAPARSPPPPPVTAPPVAAIARPPSPRPEPETPRLPPLPPHTTRDELTALVRFLKTGGTLPPEHVRELNQKGVYIRGSGASTSIVTAPGYLPQERLPPQQSESAWDKFKRRNMEQCGRSTCDIPAAPSPPPAPRINSDAEIAEIRRQLAHDMKREFERRTGRPVGSLDTAKERLDAHNAEYQRERANRSDVPLLTQIYRGTVESRPPSPERPRERYPNAWKIE